MGTNAGHEAYSTEDLENSIINWPEDIFLRDQIALGWLEHLYPEDPISRDSVRRWYLPFPNGVYMSAFYDLIITPLGGQREQQELETTWTSGLSDSSEHVLLKDAEGGILDWGAFLGRAPPEVILRTHNRDALRPIDRMVFFWGLLQEYKYPFEDEALSALRESIRPYRGEETSDKDVAALYIGPSI
ncbi:uncharacterized protein LDX57_010026 [Aspergillus melleus]|uniref:uncharacterized protein n=1 Tax=Aspergillus melleus TaxID=138277 RepID=UPI001E8E2CE4|nr:uncharacterized protein LDX57_010026 [Aspergillus melleus]KAH8432387.1 hypothetical protein LDX57_010026 [Aspergillus melleus]